jgi:hypothetical protein
MKINKFTYRKLFSNSEQVDVEIDVSDNIEVNLNNLLAVKKFIGQLSVKYNNENSRINEYLRCKNVLQTKDKWSIKEVHAAQKVVDEYEKKND